jgi:hypothetical protein
MQFQARSIYQLLGQAYAPVQPRLPKIYLVPGAAPVPSRLPHSASYCSQVLITILDRNPRSLAS